MKLRVYVSRNYLSPSRSVIRMDSGHGLFFADLAIESDHHMGGNPFWGQRPRDHDILLDFLK
jgi:hypothetical protein